MTTPAMKTLWEETLRGGAHWSGVLRRGMSLTLAAQHPGANVAALFYNYEQPLERYNMADTLKAQHTAMLTAGHVLYSDMGRILCSITEDGCGWHDPLGGLTDDAHVRERYGATRFQEQRNERYVSGRDAMLTELGKWGLGLRDLVANVNFFSKVVVDEAGRMSLAPAHCAAGASVTLRFEMHTLVLLYAGPHPLDGGRTWAPGEVRLQATLTGPAPIDDRCRSHCPENWRGFINTEAMFLP
jgi:urea carboxylase-associated protein 2